MGFVSTVVFNNDLLSHIKDDTEFGRKVHYAILSLPNRDQREWSIYSGPGQVATAVDCHHASYGVPIITGGGPFWTKVGVHISEGAGDPEIQLLKNLAEKHGFDLHRKRGSR